MRKRFLCVVLLAAACSDGGGGGGGTTEPTVTSLSVSVPTPNLAVGQTVTLSATTVGNKGSPLASEAVTWATLDPSVATVNGTGVVTAVAAGVATITATAASQVARADVYVTAGSVSCPASAAATPSVGEVRLLAGSERSAICVPALPAGSEYVLVGFNADSGAAATLTATGEQVAPVIGGPTPSLAPGGASLFAALAQPARLDGGAAQTLTPDARFHVGLLSRQRRELRGRFASAGRVLAARGATPSLSVAPTAGAAASAAVPSAPSRVVVPATKGASVRLNVQSSSACANPDYRNGKVVAVGTRSIIVADDANPSGGFTEAQYARFAANFDTLIYPTDTRYFGDPSDIDKNERSVIFFTRAVNELTPPGSESYVGGFFFGRDLLPAAPNRAQNYDGCAGSNEAEVFYMLVPDPSGAVNTNVRRTGFVDTVTTGVLAHEFQHLINFSRKIAVNAESEEVVWLNEGLSHVAEEITFYAVTKLAPRANIGVTQLRASQRNIDAFNEYQGSNFGRLRAYLQNPGGNSPYAADDSLATRGATWQFLRYAVDRTGGDEASMFKALANSRVLGFQNLNAVLGGNALNLARDWSVAQYADDANIGQNLRTSYQFASWNYRDLFASFRNSPGFPLKVTPLTTGGTVQSPLVAGGATYLRFAAAPAAPATVRLSASGGPLPAAVQLVLIRTR